MIHALNENRSEFEAQLCAALDLEPQRVKRIIIDLDVENPFVMAYVEMYAGENMIDVDFSLLKTMGIKIVSKPEAQGYVFGKEKPLFTRGCSKPIEGGLPIGEIVE